MSSYLFIYRGEIEGEKKFYEKIDEDEETKKTCNSCGHGTIVDADFEAGKEFGKFLGTAVPYEFWDGLQSYLKNAALLAIQ